MLRAAQTLLAAQQASAFTPVLVQNFSPVVGATQVVPLGATNVLIEVLGCGGGGNWCDGGGNINFSGGGGGPYSRLSIAVIGGDVLTYTVGTHGSGAVAQNTSGTTGTDTTVTGSVAGGAVAITAHSGVRALAGATTGSPGAGGTATGGSINTNGVAGGLGQPPTGKGGNSATPSGSPPTHLFTGTGGNNDTVSNNSPGNDGNFGGGGGGHQTGAANARGGNGSDGVVSFYFT